MSKFGSFIKYNNIIPITISVVLLGSATTFAATNPDTIVKKQEKILSIDNTYISEVNLKKFTPEVEILSVEEDDDNYYITYEFTTIALSNGVWKDVTTEQILEVSKRRLDRYRDLGLFVTEELNEQIKAEKKRLTETQVIEKKKKTTKRVSTTYKGIVGGFLSEKVTSIDKYKPVVKPPKPKQEVQTFALPPEKLPEQELALLPEEIIVEDVPTEEDLDDGPTTTEPNVDQDPGEATDPNSGSDTASTTEPDNEAPYLTILGDNPVMLAIGDAYTDLGATVIDDQDVNLSVTLYLDGLEVQSIELDTATATTYSIVYEAVDSQGEIAQVERIVTVYEQTSVNIPDPDDEIPTTTDENIPTTTPPTTNDDQASTTEDTPSQDPDPDQIEPDPAVEEPPIVDEPEPTIETASTTS